MPKQLSDCCKAGIKLTGKERPDAFECEECGRIIGTPMKTLPSIKERVERLHDIFVNSHHSDVKQKLTKEAAQHQANTIEAVREMLEGMDSVPFFDDSVISLTTALEQLDLLTNSDKISSK